MLHTAARMSSVVCSLARCGTSEKRLFGVRRRWSRLGRKPNTASTANTRALSGSATVRAGE